MRKPWVHLGAVVMSLALVGLRVAATTRAGPRTAAADDRRRGQQRDDSGGRRRRCRRHGGRARGHEGHHPAGELSDDFKTRLNDAWVAAGNEPLKDYNYAAETYDAIVIIALAAEKAKTDGIDYAKEINGITRDGDKCDDFASCKAIIDKGGDPDYDGLSGPLEFNGAGEPMQASYGVLQFGSDNRLDDSLTTYEQVTAPASADIPDVAVEGTRTGDGELKIGSILPQTGSLAFLGPPEFARFDLAIADINEAGGVLGKPVVGIKGDSVTPPPTP
ncbi:MAG: hypothetical protein R2755_04010 [Acidimicrobiales bacterium]